MNHSIHQLLAKASFHAHISLAAACFATLSPQAHAQVSLWNGTSGLWTDPANWQGGLVPNSPTSIAQFDAPGIYTITHPAATTTLLGLNLLNQTSLLNFQGGSVINVGMNGIRNDSFILLNSTNTLAPTQIFATESFALTGSGFLSLNAPVGDLEAASLAAADSETVILHAAPHLTRGSGTIHANLHNNSIIQADLPQRTLLLTTHPKFNSGTISAINGAILRIESPLVQSGTGVIHADNSLVQVSAPISNGSLVASGIDGLFKFSNGTSLDNVTLNGPSRLEQAMQVTQMLTNHGSLQVVPPTILDSASVLFVEDTTIGGTGEIVLNGSSTNSANAVLESDDKVFHLANHTIRGTGTISFRKDFINQGMIVADVPNRPLSLMSVKNSGTLTMRNNGFFKISNPLIQTSYGELVADDCIVHLGLETMRIIEGGTLRSLGDNGLFKVTSDTRFKGVTLHGQLRVEFTRLQISSVVGSFESTLINNGTVVIDPGTNRTATIYTLDDLILEGVGTIVLNDQSRASISSPRVVNNGPSHTIRGEGTISTLCVNQGSIISDRPGRSINYDSQTGTIFNLGDLVATNGSLHRLPDDVRQTPGRGRIVASGGEVRVRSSVSDGALYSDNGGFIGAEGTTFQRVHNHASIVLRTSSSHTLREYFENSGTILINSERTNFPPSLFLDRALQLSGTGQFILNSTPDALDAASLGGSTLNPQSPILVPPGQTIQGNGRLRGHLLHQGTLSPGLDFNGTSLPIGRIDIPVSGSLTFAATSLIDLQIAGPAPTDADHITSLSPINLDGTLRVSLSDGFSPMPGDTWTIMTGAPIAGSFSQLQLPPVTPGTAFRIVSTSDRVDLEYYCIADINNDGGVDGGDIETFFSLWEDADPRADINDDGGVDGSDIEPFFTFWEQGGC